MRIVLLMLFLVLSISANGNDEKWYELEKEVKFNPWGRDFIDSLRTSYGIKPYRDLHKVKVSLPKRDKCVYKLSWGAFNAGYGIIENNREKDTLKISGKAVTNKFVSAFFRVRDYVYTTADPEGLYPFFFEQWVEEKSYKRRRWTLYDYPEKTAHKYDGKKLKEPKEINGNYTNNYMTLLYALRNGPLVVGDTVSYPCFVHEKNYQIKNIVLKKETIKVGGKKYKTIKVQPVLVGEGHGFNSKDEMFLWFTDDNRRLMVLAKAKARLGNIRAKLDYVEVEL